MDSYRSLEQFCKNVTYLREKYRLTRTQMAQVLGVTVSVLRGIEAGKPPADMSVYVLLHAYTGFGVTAEEITGTDLRAADDAVFRQVVTVKTFHNPG